MISDEKEFTKNIDHNFRKVLKVLKYNKKNKNEEKPSWYQESFPDYNCFNGVKRPECFSGNWTKKKVQILKSIYNAYMTDDQIDQFVINQEKKDTIDYWRHHM